MVVSGAATLSETQGEEMRFAGGAGSLGRAKCVAEELISRPFANMSRRGITDIVEIEAKDTAKSGIAYCVLGAFQAIDGQTMIIDPLFPVLRHHAPGGG
jgi:hypothetical protein